MDAPFAGRLSSLLGPAVIHAPTTSLAPRVFEPAVPGAAPLSFAPLGPGAGAAQGCRDHAMTELLSALLEQQKESTDAGATLKSLGRLH